MSKAYFLYYFRAVWKRLALLRILNFKSIPSYFWTYGEVTPLLIKLMTSQAYNNNKVYIWLQALQIKFFELLIKVILTVWASARGKYKALDQCKCLACLNFLIDLRFYIVFTDGRGGEECWNSNRMEQVCWCSCGCVSPRFFPSISSTNNLFFPNVNVNNLKVTNNDFWHYTISALIKSTKSEKKWI